MNRIVSRIMLTLLLTGIWAWAFKIQPVKAEPGTIYIRADGNIEPSTANITTSDKVTYTFKGNINDSIVVQRGYIVVDGAGYTLEGAGSGNGFYLSGISSVTVKNINIKNFTNAIWLHSSTDNTISANNITNNLNHGIVLETSSSYNTISANNIMNNLYVGIVLQSSSSYNNASDNKIANNQAGFWLDSSSGHNTISRNNITDNNQSNQYAGIWLNSGNSYNIISGNSITNNPIGIKLLSRSNNNTISGNNISNNAQYGVWLDSYISNVTISGNNVAHNNQWGIWLSSSSNYNTISANDITANNWGGAVLDHSSNITISKNVFVDDGLIIMYSYGNVVIGNTVNAKPLVYLEGASNQTVAEAGQVILINCGYIDVRNLNLSRASLGLELWNTNHAVVSGNHVENNRFGMSMLSSSRFNNISGNVFVDCGLTVDGGQGNVVVDNQVNGKPLVYLEGVSGSTIENAGQVILINCNHMRVENTTFSNIDRPIQLCTTGNSRIAGNTITNNWGGIYLSSSGSNTITGNNITASFHDPGIYFSWSSANTISGNNIAHNDYDAIDLDLISQNDIICGNNISDNQRGIVFGAWFDSSTGNYVFHNNILNNTVQLAGTLNQAFDDGYPSGGNYWSDYTIVDKNSGPNQDMPGSDGLGDTPYPSVASALDHYPLAGPFRTFDAGKWNGKQYNADMVSNSTLSGFAFNAFSSPPTLSFNVTGATGTGGFCRVTIPKDLMWCDSPSQWIVTVDNTPLSNPKIIPHLNLTYICFAYTHSIKTVQIQSTHAIPEFQPLLLLPLLMSLALVTAVVRKKEFKRFGESVLEKTRHRRL